MRSSKLFLHLLLLVSLAWLPPTQAQDFPSKPIRIVVPVLGGTMDLLARLVAPLLSERSRAR
jgi:tripartite-type tricarboxylate transporter receptor subunit TctC